MLRQIPSAAGFDNIITGDMGGTSFDVSLVADGQNMLTAQANIDFGMTIRVMIEMTTIGAGGGSIGHIDETGLLEIGLNLQALILARLVMVWAMRPPLPMLILYRQNRCPIRW